MAYTKIHPIRVTLGKAIDYVCKFEKTGNGQYKKILLMKP